MSEQQEQRKQVISSLIAGIIFGILMAGILVFLFQQSDYKFYSKSFWLILVVACMLPGCFDFFEKRGLSLWMIEPIMIGISFIIMLLYARSVGGNEATRQLFLQLVTIYHANSLLFTLLRLWIIRKVLKQ